MGLKITTSGSFAKTESFCKAMQKPFIVDVLNSAGRLGVSALSNATPRESGRASTSWGFKVINKTNSCTIVWTNNDVEDGFPVAIMLQYGYGTGTGGYIQGRDYINPAMRPIFDQIANKVWKAVTSA